MGNFISGNLLKQVGASEFNKILPIINNLIQKDIVRLLPDDLSYSITANPLFLKE